jgi:hypothetical protein
MIKDCGTLLINMVNQNVDDGPDIARLFTLVLASRKNQMKSLRYVRDEDDGNALSIKRCSIILCLSSQSGLKILVDRYHI